METKQAAPVVKRFGVDFDSPGGALTLESSDVSEAGDVTGEYERTHPDGWTIKGEVKEDYYYWVNAFEAHHPTHGRVWGDFEAEVFADTEEGFADFFANHPPAAWDYADI